jgi:hypothetical protein
VQITVPSPSGLIHALTSLIDEKRLSSHVYRLGRTHEPIGNSNPDHLLQHLRPDFVITCRAAVP